jgi:hypothetical protein
VFVEEQVLRARASPQMVSPWSRTRPRDRRSGLWFPVGTVLEKGRKGRQRIGMSNANAFRCRTHAEPAARQPPQHQLLPVG